MIGRLVQLHVLHSWGGATTEREIAAVNLMSDDSILGYITGAVADIDDMDSWKVSPSADDHIAGYSMSRDLLETFDYIFKPVNHSMDSIIQAANIISDANHSVFIYSDSALLINWDEMTLIPPIQELVYGFKSLRE